MRRREFITLTGATVAWPFAAVAQEPGRTYRLGCLFPVPRGSAEDAWFDKLRRRGFIEGQNLTIEYRSYAQHVDLVPQYAAELVKARVDVIATAGDEAVRVRSAGDENHSNRWVRRRYAGVRTSDLASAAGRQYDGRQYPCVRG